MTANTGNTEFRKVDVDLYTESTFRDEQTEETTPIRLNEAEVKSSMERGKPAEGLMHVLQNAPINSKDQALKDLAFRLVMRLLAQIKPANIDEFVASLDSEKIDLLMKYIYRGFENAQDGNSAMLLTWHEKLTVRRIYPDIIKALVNDDPETLRKHVKNPRLKTSITRIQPVTENSLFDVTKKRNLLHLAVLYGATQCVTMLIEPPFLWDPDKPDAFGWTAMQLAEALNNIHTMYPLACASRELRHFEPLVLNKENHLITTRLFWPQDMMVYTFLKSPISTRRARTRNRIPLETPWQLSRGGPELFGSHLALLFELLLSESPPLPRGDWDHDQVEPLVTWPIRMAPLRNREGHTPDCTNYPNCLSTHWLRTYHRCRDLWDSYQETAELWKLHRFGGIYFHQSEPLSLQDQCRVCLRRQLLINTQPALTDTQAHIYPNYAKILGELNLPAEIFDFLLYRDLWPVQNRKETIEQEEEPVAKRACFYKWTEQFGVGLRIAHGFIPLSADS